MPIVRSLSILCFTLCVCACAPLPKPHVSTQQFAALTGEVHLNERATLSLQKQIHHLDQLIESPQPD